MSVEPNQLLGIAQQVLGLMGVYDYTGLQLTYAIKDEDEWRVNVSFTRRGALVKSVACFSVSAESKEITGMYLDRTWK